MAPSGTTPRTRPKSKVTSTATPSSAVSPSPASPDLLQTVQALQQRIAELENEGQLTKADRDELKKLREAGTTLNAAKDIQDGPESKKTRKPLSAGWF